MQELSALTRQALLLMSPAHPSHVSNTTTALQLPKSMTIETRLRATD